MGTFSEKEIRCKTITVEFIASTRLQMISYSRPSPSINVVAAKSKLSVNLKKETNIAAAILQYMHRLQRSKTAFVDHPPS